MPNTEYKLCLPDEFLPLMNKLKGETFEKKVQVALSINLFVNKTVSLEKAAQLSGETLNNFIEILKDENIPWMEYTEEDKKQDDKVVKKMMKELGI
jgi:predicted HTH domain antitoxin